MTKREHNLVVAAEALLAHTDYNNKNLTKKQDWLLDDLKEALLAYYTKDDIPPFKRYC